MLTVVASATAQAQSLPLGKKQIETKVTEWDLPVSADGTPGAISVDLQGNAGHKIWFVTRAGAPRVYNLDVGRNFKSGQAIWTSWSLHPDGLGPTGGVKKLKPSYDRRFVFVRTLVGLHKVDTANNVVTLYPDFSLPENSEPNVGFVSDVAADNGNRVYYAVRDAEQTTGFIKRINASVHCAKDKPCPPAEVVKWEVGGGVGSCVNDPEASSTTPCLSGVAVHPKAQHLVYYSDNLFNEIGELDTNSKTCSSCYTSPAKTRRWSLTPVGARGPRQLNIDKDGLIWVVTTSGHLVSLNPKTSKMTSHKIPTTGLNTPLNDTFGVAPDGGMIGYTDTVTVTNEHKVAMLIPQGNGKYVGPTYPPAPRTTEDVIASCATSFRDCGEVCPIRRTVPTKVTPTTSEGTFVEALVNQNTDPNQPRSSLIPLGITPDFDRSTGAFFFAVGQPEPEFLVKRIGHVRLTREKQKGKHDRDDEDIDDDGKNHHDDDDDDDDGWKDHDDDDDDNDGDKDDADDDDDNDGIKDHHDTKDRESQDNYSSQMSAGQTEEFQMTAGASTLAMIVTAVADNPLAPISLEVRNPAGLLVLSTPPTPGVTTLPVPASGVGIYTVRVKNAGLNAVGISTTLLTRELRVP